jgi:hypothetical protein
MCTLNRVAFLGIVIFVVRLWLVGCGSSGFGSSFCNVLVWFVCIWMCSQVGFCGV